MTNKVVITGIGVISPIGNELQTFTDSLRSGINGVGDISLFDTSDFNVNIAAESSVKLEDFFDKKELNRLDRFTAFSLIASRQAVKQAKLINPKDDNNIGVIVGSGIGGINTFEVQHKRLLKHPKRLVLTLYHQ